MNQPESDNPKIIFIADYFLSEILGGGELNDDELIKLLKKENKVTAIKSRNVTLGFLKSNSKSKYIISNFAELREETKSYITKNINYILYEHDHKYIPSRNPGLYDSYQAPPEHIINFNFYKCAKTVFCQSNFHKNILEKNLNLTNIASVGGNLWSLDALEHIEKLSVKKKNPMCSIMDSQIPHKNTKKAVAFCEHKGYEYELIKSSDYKTFLSNLTNNEKLVFFPDTPETLSRIVVEARMSGMNTVTSKNIGAVKESWFSLKGKELIYVMKTKRLLIRNMVLDSLK